MIPCYSNGSALRNGQGSPHAKDQRHRQAECSAPIVEDLGTGCVLYRRDGTWIDVDPEESQRLIASGEYADSPAGPWKAALAGLFPRTG